MSGANGVMKPKGGTPNIATRSVAKGNALYPAMLLLASAGKSILLVFFGLIFNRNKGKYNFQSCGEIESNRRFEV